MVITMADNVSITVRIDPSIRDRLDKLAEQTERSRAWHVIKALEQYLDETEQDMAGILESIRADDANELISGEEMGRMIQELIAANKVA